MTKLKGSSDFPLHAAVQEHLVVTSSVYIWRLAYINQTNSPIKIKPFRPYHTMQFFSPSYQYYFLFFPQNNRKLQAGNRGYPFLSQLRMCYPYWHETHSHCLRKQSSLWIMEMIKLTSKLAKPPF